MSCKVLITGSGTRLGREIALGLAGAGCEICIHYFRAKVAAESLRDGIVDGGGRAFAFFSDFNDPNSYAELYLKVVDALGGLDLLINSASPWEMGSRGGGDTLACAAIEDWDYRLNVGARAAFFLIQLFSEELSRSSNGSVINLLDTSISEPYLKHACHSISKAALLCVTKLASRSLESVRVNALELGRILPDGDGGSVGYNPAVSEVVDAVKLLMEDEDSDGKIIRVRTA